MSNVEILLIVSGVTLVAGILIGFGFPYLKSKGVNVQGVINEAKEVAEELDNAADVIKDVIPDSIVKSAVEYIAEHSLIEKAVGAVDQLYISGQITDPNQRKEDAVNSVINDLNLVGIKVNDKFQKSIELSIEYLIGKSKNSDEKANQLNATQQKTITDLQKQLSDQVTQSQITINQLATENQSLQNKVNDLTNKINSFTAAVMPNNTTAQ